MSAFNPNNKFSQENNSGLLLLWGKRHTLPQEDAWTLRMELLKRHLSEEAREVEMWNTVDYGLEGNAPYISIDIHQTYLHASVLFYAIREMWLRDKTREGVSVTAIVSLAYHTQPVSKQARRAEMLYSYEYRGDRFEGRVIRDYFLNSKAANALANDFCPGQQITVKIVPNQPHISYFPSGFGFIEAFTTGLIFPGLILVATLFLVLSLTFAMIQKIAAI